MPIDARQRQQALDPARSFIVQAPAGSGKTELLTQRFLKLLAQVERPERILAITFTRKATQEMRGRILRRLQQAGSGEQPEQEHERLAIELARKVLKRDAEAGWNLPKNGGRLRILTIDGLCSQLLLRDPQRGAHFAGRRVLDDAKPLYRLAVRSLFEHLGQYPGESGANNDPTGAAQDALIRLLVHVDGNAKALQDLLVSMMQVRDQWTKRIGSDPETMKEVLLERQQQELDRLVAALGAAELEQAATLLTELGSALDDPDSAAARYSKAACQQENGLHAQLNRMFLMCTFFLTAAGGPRSPGGISKALFKGISDDLAPLIPQLKSIYALWHERDISLAAIQRMAKTPPIDLTPPRDELRDDIREILKHALAHLRVVFDESGTADFQYVAELALESLGDEDAPGQVLLQEDQRLDHILMDEFQDTSNTQFEMLEKLMAGWQPGAGRSLLLVGDPMQSIYRFREANVGLFIDVVQKGRVGEMPVSCLQLHSNFRSTDEIVSWVNSQFSQIFPATAERDSGAVSYTRARSERGPGGLVELHPLASGNDDADEAGAVLEIIRRSRQRFGDPTIAVLARARAHLGALAQALVREGIGFEAVRIDSLAVRPVIRDLVALSRALSHPADRVAWLSLLRAPWCGLDTTRLHRVAGDDRWVDLFERIRLASQDQAADLGENRELQRLDEVLGHALRMRGSRTLRQRVEYAWLHLGGPYCCASAAELDNAEAFFDLLDELEREGEDDLIGRLDEKLGNLYARSQPSKLQLMTIHQAKGLEFDVVIIPGLHKGTRGGDPSLVSLQEFRMDDGRDAVLMAPIPPRGEVAPSIYRYLNAVNTERGDYEIQRLLYVASTRARQALHLIGRLRRDRSGRAMAPKGTFLKMLEPAFVQQMGPAADRVESAVYANEDAQALPLLRLAGHPELPVLKEWQPEPGQLQLPSLPRREAVALGEALHQWLELIHDHWDQPWDADWFGKNETALLSTLRRAGAVDAQLPELLPLLREMLIKAVTTDPGRSVISPVGKPGSWTELELFRAEGSGVSRHIIDRLYQKTDGQYVVIDYKSGKDSRQSRSLWHEQLNRYRVLVNELGSGRVAETRIYQATDGRMIDPADGHDLT